MCECVFVGKSNFGYNVLMDIYEDFIKVGVIDLVKVIKMVLLNVVSVFILLLISDVLVVDFFKEDGGKGYGGYDDIY